MDLQHCSLSKLAEVLAQAEQEIIGEWRLQATALLRERHLSKLTLTDHLPDLVAEITRDLKLDRDGTVSAEQTRGSPPVHGVQRFHDGLDVGEVVAEYNLLRIAFTTIAERHGLYLVGRAALIINHRIDEGVRLAVMAFAAQQALMRKEQEDEHLAFLAHDLRTPLNAVSLIAREIKEGLNPAALEEAGDLFELLGRNVHRITELLRRVEDKLLHANEAGSSFRPEFRSFELWPLVQRLILDLRAISSKDQIHVVNEVPRALTICAGGPPLASLPKPARQRFQVCRSRPRRRDRPRTRWRDRVHRQR